MRWLRPVLAIIAGGMVAALLIVHNGRGAGFGSQRRVALLSGGDRSLWQKGYLWAEPGDGQNNDFERAQSLVDRRSKAMEAEKKSRHLDLDGRSEELLQAGRQGGLKIASGQVLCGLGVGCEVENAKDLDGAERFDRKTVQKGHWDPKRMVSGDTISEIGDAVDAYAHEVGIVANLYCRTVHYASASLHSWTDRKQEVKKCTDACYAVEVQKRLRAISAPYSSDA